MRQSYSDLGNAYLRIGELQKALDHLQKELEIAKREEDKAREGTAHCNLGKWYQSIGDFKKAEKYHKFHLKIARKIKDKSGEGTANQNLGFVDKSWGKHEEANKRFERHLEIAKELGDTVGEANANGNLGCVQFSLGDFESATNYHEQNLSICRQMGDRVGEGIACRNLGDVYQRQEKFDEAIAHYKRSLDIAEKEGDVAAIAELNYLLGRSFARTGFTKQALDCFEYSVELYNVARSSHKLKDDCKINLQDKFQRVYTSLWRLLLKEGEIVKALSSAEEGRAKSLEDLIKSNYNLETYHSVKGNVLDVSSDTVFIAFECKEIILWVLRKGKPVELRRKQICTDRDMPCDALSFFDSLKQDAYRQIDVKVDDLRCEDRSLGEWRDEVPIDETPAEKRQSEPSNFQNAALSSFFDYIIDPIKDLLSGNEIVFVPEGPLCLAPFAAFMDTKSKYLCESFRIRVIPSLTSFKLLADCPQGKHFENGALLVGDPLLDEIPPEQRKKIKQLPWAKAEVEMIGQIVNTSPLTRGEATKEEVLKRLRSVALVHIAAHGRMETGEILLAPNPSRESPVKEEDYLLTVNDVLSFQIRPRLVVLSCCHTARGKIKAEGVVGIARAFLGAGARSVLVSLWAIDDEATLEFMRNFYDHLVEGKSASEALNEARKCMRESEIEKFKKVKHWAPFVLIGDDVTLKFDKL